MGERMSDEQLERLRADHFPWSYTGFGVLCWCGGAMDENEECSALRLVSEIDRQRAEIADLTAKLDAYRQLRIHPGANPASDAMSRLEAMGNG